MRIPRSALFALVPSLALLAACAPPAEEPEEAADEARVVAGDTAPAAVAQCPELEGMAILDQVAVGIEAGSVKVDPETVYVAPGGEVTWESEYPFVAFVQTNQELGLPTDQAAVARGKAKGDGKGKGKALVRSDAACGQYEYKLGVFDPGTGEMLTLDPPLMVVP